MMDHLYMTILTFHNSSRTEGDYRALFDAIGPYFNATGAPSQSLLTSLHNAVGSVELSFDVETATSQELTSYIGDILARNDRRRTYSFKLAARELKRRGYPVPVLAYYMDGHVGDLRYLVMEYNE